jgi:RNA polymerase sigma factor (sigma-70 family)
MTEKDPLSGKFEAHRARLRKVAYRMLGSQAEADDAVQEAWLRLSRQEAGGIDNLGGWLTTVVARVCLDMLRSRKTRAEEPMDDDVPEPAASDDAEQEALLADSVGLALQVVLQTLAPAERVAFVLHDIFAVPFDDIAPIVGRSSAATRQLASRARRRVQGTPAVSDEEVTRQQKVVDAFLAASRHGDFQDLLAVLDPDVVMRADEAAMRLEGTAEIRGAQAVAQAFKGRARSAQSALVNGAVGVVVAPRGELLLVLNVTVVNDKITAIDAIADPERLAGFDLAVLGT